MLTELLLNIPSVRKLLEKNDKTRDEFIDNVSKAWRAELDEKQDKIDRLQREIASANRAAEDSDRAVDAAKESNERLNERVRQLSDAVLKERDEASKRQVEITRLKADIAHEQHRVEAKSRVISELRASRNLVWLRPAVPLNREQLREAFEVDETDLLWRSINQVLDDAIGDALDEVTQRKLSQEDRAHAAGGAEALRQFQKALLDWYSLAHRDEAEDPSEDAA